VRKVGIVGAGAVGAACAIALALRRSADEILLVNRTTARGDGIATDITYSAAKGDTTAVRRADFLQCRAPKLLLESASLSDR
jgi:L-lactate dehydrogenase